MEVDSEGVSMGGVGVEGGYRGGTKENGFLLTTSSSDEKRTTSSFERVNSSNIAIILEAGLGSTFLTSIR